MKISTRTIKMSEVINSGISNWSLKDNSPRGIKTVYTGELKIGDMIVWDNYFTMIIEG